MATAVNVASLVASVSSSQPNAKSPELRFGSLRISIRSGVPPFAAAFAASLADFASLMAEGVQHTERDIAPTACVRTLA